MLLHPNEVELIQLIRGRARYGEILIVTKDGLPQRIRRTVTYFSCNVDNEPLDEYNDNAIL